MAVEQYPGMSDGQPSTADAGSGAVAEVEGKKLTLADVAAGMQEGKRYALEAALFQVPIGPADLLKLEALQRDIGLDCALIEVRRPVVGQ